MIISARTGRKLVALGKAKAETIVRHEDRRYMAITRYDIQRTDHYPLRDGEVS